MQALLLSLFLNLVRAKKNAKWMSMCKWMYVRMYDIMYVFVWLLYRRICNIPVSFLPSSVVASLNWERARAAPFDMPFTPVMRSNVSPTPAELEALNQVWKKRTGTSTHIYTHTRIHIAYKVNMTRTYACTCRTCRICTHTLARTHSHDTHVHAHAARTLARTRSTRMHAEYSIVSYHQNA